MRNTQTAAQGDILQSPIINPQSAIPQLAVGKIRQKATECDRTLRKLVRARAFRWFRLGNRSAPYRRSTPVSISRDLCTNQKNSLSCGCQSPTCDIGHGGKT